MESVANNTKYHPTNYYWQIVKDMEQSQKLDLISMLIDSLRPSIDDGNKGSYQRSQEDIRAGRVESFTSSDEMFKSLGI